LIDLCHWTRSIDLCHSTGIYPAPDSVYPLAPDPDISGTRLGYLRNRIRYILWIFSGYSLDILWYGPAPEAVITATTTGKQPIPLSALHEKVASRKWSGALPGLLLSQGTNRGRIPRQAVPEPSRPPLGGPTPSCGMKMGSGNPRDSLTGYLDGTTGKRLATPSEEIGVARSEPFAPRFLKLSHTSPCAYSPLHTSPSPSLISRVLISKNPQKAGPNFLTIPPGLSLDVVFLAHSLEDSSDY